MYDDDEPNPVRKPDVGFRGGWWLLMIAFLATACLLLLQYTAEPPKATFRKISDPIGAR
jgi:hypothetical protein